jgi:hypothetical protein
MFLDTPVPAESEVGQLIDIQQVPKPGLQRLLPVQQRWLQLTNELIFIYTDMISAIDDMERAEARRKHEVQLKQ